MLGYQCRSLVDPQNYYSVKHYYYYYRGYYQSRAVTRILMLRRLAIILQHSKCYLHPIDSGKM